MNRYGAQRSSQLRPRCIGTVRSRTQSQINQSSQRRNFLSYTLCRRFSNHWASKSS